MSEPVAPLDSSWHVSGDEPICPKFQPNIFDPSRCHECLRQRQLHTGAAESTDTVPQQKSLTEPQTGTDPIGSGFGSNRGVLLTPIPSQAEESNTSSSKDESDSFSVVSSYDVNGGCAGYGSLCILSPDCELYICEGDDDYSTDSCRDQSEEFSSSISAEEEYLPIQRRPTRYSMTRLDPPPHRPNPRAWMEDTRGGSSLTGRSGLKEDRERHESGYYSLGRATGARLLSEKSPPAPFRHFERGHPLFSNRNIEPKDTIPFRNPNLGVASERQIPEAYDESLPVEIPPPDPYEVAVEVEAQVGPRSPSPTPFKIAESLASSGRKGSGRGYPLSQNSSYQQSERYDSSRQSRSSSPSRGNLQIRRSESSDLLGGKNFDGGGRSHATTPRSMSPLPNTQGRHFASGTLPRNFKSFASQSTQGQRFEAGTLPRNFKSFASSVKSQSNAISDFRSTLHKKEVNGSSVGRGDVRSSSPSRTDRNSSVLMSRHSESTTNLSHGRGGNSRASSPSRRTSDRARDTHFSSLPSRNFSPISRSILRKSESVVSLNEHSHHGRCGSPIREGYSIENQAQLRHELTRTGLNDEEHNEDPTVSLSRQDYDRPRQYVLRKTEANTVSSGRGWESRSSSPGRRIHETPDQHQLRRRNPSGGSLNGHGHEKRNSSPSRRNYEATSQSLQSKSEFNSSVRNNDSYSSSALRKTYDAPDQRKPQIIKAGFSINSKTQNTRSYSPCQKGSADPPGYSVFRSATNEQSSHSFQRKNTSEVNLDSSRSPNSWRGSSLHSSSISRSTSPSRQNPNGNRITRVTLETTRTSSSIRSAHSRLRDEDRCPTPNSKQPSQQARSPSFPPQMDKRSSHRAQSPSPPPKIDKRSSHRTQSPSPPPQIDKRSSHRTQTPSPPTQIDKRSSHRAQSPSPSTQFYKRSSHRARSPSPSPQLNKWSSHRARSPSPPPQTDKRSSHRARSPSPSPQPNKWSSHRARSPSPPTQTDKRSSHRARSPSPSPQIDKRSSHHAQRPSPSALINKRSSHRAQSPSPPPQIHIQSHTSSQSSLASSESVPNSVGSTGRNREEYTMMADVPKVKMIHQREEMSHTGPQQNNQPIRRQELFKPASHSLSRHPSTEWDDTWDMEREWHYGGSGYLSRAQSTTSLQRSGSPTTADEGSSWKSTDHRSEQMQPDLLNFKKGWMSKLDESGEWKKHWFVLTDAGLKYYRDSSAEEKDDLDGEIDLKSCVTVSEFDVEKNYGFRIQTREAMFTLSAMTAGIRRNWIEVLKKCIRPSSSPDLTQLPDNNSDKENSHTRFLSSRHQSLRHGDSQSEVSSSAPAIKHRFDYVELSPVPASSGALPPGQREAGEGQGREHSQWQEERNTSSQWEAVLSRKGTTVGSNQRLHMEDEIEKKWAEFERMPLKEMSSIPPTHSRSSSQSAETLQREVASLRQQLAQLQQGGGGGGGKVWGVCGPEAPCSRSLVAMERAHKQALEELQRQHERQMRELEREKDRLLLEEAQDTARVMEALKKKHKEELEREVETVKRLSSGKLDSQSLRSQQQAETQSLQRELAGLSERYSQKCLELNQAEQRNAEREREISRKERDMEQLRKENLDLKARLTEEMTRIRSAVTDPCSEDPKDKRPCELQVLLRMKENEIEYLHKEISCLRNELQFLNMEKQLACERYAEVHGELNGMKGRTEREIQSLKEHLRLALAALQEGQKLGNSLDH